MDLQTTERFENKISNQTKYYSLMLAISKIKDNLIKDIERYNNEATTPDFIHGCKVAKEFIVDEMENLENEIKNEVLISSYQFMSVYNA